MKKNYVLLIILLLSSLTVVNASQRFIAGEVFTETW